MFVSLVALEQRDLLLVRSKLVLYLPLAFEHDTI
jgi:hypothetical protein